MDDKTVALVISVTAPFLPIALFLIFFRYKTYRPAQLSNSLPYVLEDLMDRPLTKEIGPEGSRAANLRELRYLIRQERVGAATDGDSDELFLTASVDPTHKTWQNQAAYNLALALEKIGALVMSGAIPIELVIPMNAHQIVEDWHYCHRLVQRQIQGRRPLVAKEKQPGKIRLRWGLGPRIELEKEPPIKFQHRHAEWLACVAAMYLHSHWHEGHKRIPVHMGPPGNLRLKEARLRRVDHFFAPSRLTGQVRRLTRPSKREWIRRPL